MIIRTSLPVSPMFFKHWHTDDTEIGVIVAKARFAPNDAGVFEPVGAPPPLIVADSFEGDPATGYLLAEQDIAPGKAATDLLINAVARAPGDKPLADWAVEVNIPDRLTYGFQVRGPCQWERKLGRWRTSKPEPVREVPLTYALAYGGAAPGEDPEVPDIYEFNPSGIGYANAARLAQKESFPACQIGELAEFIAADIRAEMSVHGFGPIAKAWLPRRSDAGTFDEEWQQTRHPRMPHDYGLRFWNCAPLSMQLNPHLRGDEAIQLTGLSHDAAPIKLQLPGAGLRLALSGEEERTIDMTLDTISADVRDTDPQAHTLDLVWRALIPDPGNYARADIAPYKVG